jgi:hypothetical protein
MSVFMSHEDMNKDAEKVKEADQRCRAEGRKPG